MFSFERFLRVSASDPAPHCNEDLDCGRSYRYATRVRWTQWPGADCFATAALLRTCVRVSRAQRRYRKTLGGGRRWSVPVRQATGTWTLHLAEGRERNGSPESRTAFDASGRYRLAESGENMAAGSRRLMTKLILLYSCGFLQMISRLIDGILFPWIALLFPI